MATKSFVVTPQMGGGVKSIPIHATTPEQWRSWRDGLTSFNDDDLLMLYSSVAWFGRAVDTRADAIANLPWTFSRVGSDSELDEGELPKFPFALDMDNLLNMLEAWLCLYGAAYLFKGPNAAGIPKELRPMHPKSITPKFDNTVGLTGFTRKMGDGQTLPLSPVELAYIWLPPRAAEVGPGSAPARKALAAASLLASTDDFGKMYFENGVIAPTLVTVPAGTQDAEKQRLEAWAKRAMGGLKKAFNVIGIAAEVKVNSLGDMLPLGSLALPELTDKKREDISTAFGIPQTLLFSNAANFATAQQDKLNFYDETVIPEAKRIEAALNAQVFGPLGWTLNFKPERIEVYQAQESDKGYKLSSLYEKGLVTIEEVRQQLGMPDRPSVGELLDPLAILAARGNSSAAAPAPAMRSVDISQSTEQKAIADELAAWERKAIKRLREGKPDKAAEFDSDVLPVYTRAWVEEALRGAATVDAVKAAFAGVSEWASYP